jgi:hypothetical protein
MSGDGVGASRGPDNLETCWTPVVRFLDAQVLIATAWVAAAQGVVSEVQRIHGVGVHLDAAGPAQPGSAQLGRLADGRSAPSSVPCAATQAG